MIYSTGNTHILSAILTKVTGSNTWQFAQEALAKPLGFTLAPWMRDPQGVYFGGNEMVMTPRQMLAFGELYLNGGQVGGRQIISKAFIDETFKPRGRSRISGREYGYGWWMREMAGRQTYYAWGLAGSSSCSSRASIWWWSRPRPLRSATIGGNTGAASTTSSKRSSSRRWPTDPGRFRGAVVFSGKTRDIGSAGLRPCRFPARQSAIALQPVSQ
jgi:CubicO group peptidase (beta-lactamase class C family)